MSCLRGSRPDLRIQTYLPCICQAACAVSLSPLQPVHFFLPVGGNDKGKEMLWWRRGMGWTEWEAGDPDPAKWLSYMENTSRLQGNGTTSEFWQTKITPVAAAAYSHSSCTTCSLRRNSQTPYTLVLERSDTSVRIAHLLSCYPARMKFNNSGSASHIYHPFSLWMQASFERPIIQAPLLGSFRSFKHSVIRFPWPNAL